MADKKMNQFTTAKDGAYIYAEAADGSQIKIAKADLVELIREAMPTVSSSRNGLVDKYSGFYHRGIITTQDFDTLEQNGTYQLSNATGNNAPSTYGIMAVFGSSGMVLQIFGNAMWPFDYKFRIKGFGEQAWCEWKSLG